MKAITKDRTKCAGGAIGENPSDEAIAWQHPNDPPDRDKTPPR
jgi:hypothetical protein